MIFFSKNESVTNILPMKIAIECHITPAIDTLISVKWDVCILTDCTVKARTGILQSQAHLPAC